MNFEADELLDLVDQWKFKLHEQLKKLTPQARAAFWKRVRGKARAAGLPLAKPVSAASSKRRRTSGR